MRGFFSKILTIYFSVLRQARHERVDRCRNAGYARATEMEKRCPSRPARTALGFAVVFVRSTLRGEPRLARRSALNIFLSKAWH